MLQIFIRLLPSTWVTSFNKTEHNSPYETSQPTGKKTPQDQHPPGVVLRSAREQPTGLLNHMCAIHLKLTQLSILMYVRQSALC